MEALLLNQSFCGFVREHLAQIESERARGISLYGILSALKVAGKSLCTIRNAIYRARRQREKDKVASRPALSSANALSISTSDLQPGATRRIQFGALATPEAQIPSRQGSAPASIRSRFSSALWRAPTDSIPDAKLKLPTSPLERARMDFRDLVRLTPDSEIV
jgi:hypothetical protein